MSSGKKIFFENLDSIRFFAAMMVFFQHAVKPTFENLDLLQNTQLLKFLNVICDGGTGVSVFFVLSGFLITYLIISEIKITGRLGLINFYIRRFLRIWPLYILIVCFSFLLYPGLKDFLGVNKPLCSNIWYHLVFISNFDIINVREVCYELQALTQSVTWSVSVEEQFYLFWPLIFLLPKKLWLYIISFLVIFSLYFRYNHQEDFTIMYFHTFSVLIDLTVGALLAHIVIYSDRIKKYFENSNTLSHALLFIITFLVLFFGTEIIFGAYNKTFERLITSILFALIIGSQSFTKNKSILCLGNIKFADKWGKKTYGIYLLHPIAISIIDISFRLLGFFKYKDSFLPHISATILMYILTLGLCWISYHYFEKHFLKMKSKYQKIKSHTILEIKKVNA